MSEPAEHPGGCLTVVVPCYNEAERVTDALAAVLASPYVAEVVVVDDGSTDATAKLVEAVVAVRRPGAPGAPAVQPGQGRRPAPRLPGGHRART